MIRAVIRLNENSLSSYFSFLRFTIISTNLFLLPERAQLVIRDQLLVLQL